MIDGTSNLNQRLANRVRDLRSARSLSLADLAKKSGVSRSMISLIERGESSATAVMLEKLASGLGLTLGALFEAAEPAPTQNPGPVARKKDQPFWRDPASGYRRRNVSPSGIAGSVRIVEVQFPPGARVAFESGVRQQRVDQQVWILSGSIHVTAGTTRHQLRTGDCLAMRLDQPTMFHNPTRKPARYAVVVSTSGTLLS